MADPMPDSLAFDVILVYKYLTSDYRRIAMGCPVEGRPKIISTLHVCHVMSVRVNYIIE